MKKYLVLAMLFLLIGCGQSSNDTTDVSGLIHDHLGMTPYLPNTDYPIGSVIIEYSQIMDNGEMTKGDPSMASIHYLISQDKKMDDDFLEAWENDHPFEEIVHGDLYMDPNAIIVTVAPDGAGNLMDAELIEIEGQEVQYQYIDREPESVFIFMNLDNMGYQIQYSADTEDIEEEAKAFAKEIINNN